MSILNKLAAGVITVGAVVLVSKFIEVHKVYKKARVIMERFEKESKVVENRITGTLMFRADKVYMVNELIGRYKREYSLAGFDKEGEVFFERQRELLLAMI